MPPIFPIRTRILAAPTAKRLSGLTCLELRKEIQESVRKNLKMRAVWEQFMYEVCIRISKYMNAPKDEKVDKFTPTDISLILSSFATARIRIQKFLDFVIESVRGDIKSYDLRDIAIFYNSLAKLRLNNVFIFDKFKGIIEARLTSKISEKDLSLLLNALLELQVKDIKEIFLKSSLILSSRIKFLDNCHTLTLLLHSYSRLYNDGKILELSGSDKQREDGNIEIDPEYTLISSTTISLLEKSMELVLNMRPTDLLYMYKSSINILYNTTGIKQQVYCKIIRMYKLHNKILEHMLEFESRELVSLLKLFPKVSSKSHTLADEGPVEVIKMEIERFLPTLTEKIVNELSYRLRVLSLADSVEFLKLLQVGDHRRELVYKRLYQKLNREKIWEPFKNGDIFTVMEEMASRGKEFGSKDAQLLFVSLVKNLSGILKLREICTICSLAAKFGVKTNSLERRVRTVMCRADYLQPTQIASLIPPLVALGYLEAFDTIILYANKITNPSDSLDVLVALSILKLNSLREPDSAIVNHLKSNLQDHDVQDERKLAFISAAGLIDYSHPFKIGKNLYSPQKYGGIDTIFLEKSAVKFSYTFLTFEEYAEEFTDELSSFISKFDPLTRFFRNVQIENIVIPVVIESDKGKIAVVPLLDDFYATTKAMLRIDKFSQLKLLEKLQIPRICCNVYDYRKEENKSQFLARFLERCHAEIDKFIEKVDVKPQEQEEMNKKQREAPTSKLNNFSRLRLLLATN
ncbi:hypothetical protein BEWA_022050 [Theileria equi strain WA]|uniref:RAP domain-containing protein n=1 Tax=Theileria equi strain WA TaxID=1537102 RepID=L0AUR0_THEEQ|nr:hypothetical protein BEWA_022050 [Theileria equi strain WA]AFZ79357.1 hypothetical protein BEWA_022050 [Theileria equi strain WA]|eukprot:XP_004829023.1 hypothetical protein BEWA_022050 [Theileria equi strain WA]